MGKAAPTVYEIMHGDRKVAQIDQYGHSKIYFESFIYSSAENLVRHSRAGMNAA